MLIDCDSCPVAGRHCPECVVTAVWSLPTVGRAQIDGPPIDRAPTRGHPQQHPSAQHGAGPAGAPRRAYPAEYLDAIERRAVAAFLQAGLVSAEVVGQLRAEQVPPRAGRAVG